MLEIFPRDISIKYGSMKKMSWDTKIERSGANKVRTCTNTLYPRWEVEVKATALTNEDARRVQGFFATLRGASRPFLWYDHEDNTETNVLIGIGDGVTTEFYLIRTLGAFAEPVLDLVEDSVQIQVDGQSVGCTVKENGLIVLDHAPEKGAQVRGYYQYYWRVMLERDEFKITNKFNDFNEVTSFTMGVVR